MCVFFFAKSLVSSARKPREANDSDDNFMGIELKRNFHIRQETQFFSCCLIHAISSRSNVDREGLILEEIFFSQHEIFFDKQQKAESLNIVIGNRLRCWDRYYDGSQSIHKVENIILIAYSSFQIVRVWSFWSRFFLSALG